MKIKKHKADTDEKRERTPGVVGDVEEREEGGPETVPEANH